MRVRPVVAAALLIAGLTGLSGCDGSATPRSTPSTGFAGSGNPSTKQSTSPSTTPSVMLTPTAAADTALGAGERVWAAFSETGLSYDDWWSQLEPMLSKAAQAQYVYDDPRNLPAMTLTGSLTVAPKPPARAGFTSEVVVPTSVGTFRLDLERRTRSSPWVLYGIRFPPKVG